MTREVPVLVFPLLYVFVAVALGVVSRRNGRTRQALLVGSAIAVGITVLLLSGARDEDVTNGRFAGGLLLGGISLGLVPYGVFFGLGSWFGERRVLLAVAVTAVFVGFLFYGFLALLMTYDLIACTPDAYECPI